MSIAFEALAGSTNYLQTASTPIGVFADIDGSLVVKDSGLIQTNFIEVGAATNKARFYRIRQLP